MCWMSSQSICFQNMILSSPYFENEYVFKLKGMKEVKMNDRRIVTMKGTGEWDLSLLQALCILGEIHTPHQLSSEQLNLILE